MISITRRDERIIPLTAIDRIFAESDYDFIEFKPNFELGKLLEKIALEIIEIAEVERANTKRKTLMDVDIKNAFKKWKEQNLKGEQGNSKT
ncbi:MAG: hypothetical protein ACFFCS_20900 [Candidatus Hodarchaeota archaeon]